MNKELEIKNKKHSSLQPPASSLQCGFSLIESLVAIAVLLLAVTGTLTIASRSILISEQSRDQVTAAYLAEEGIEFVRNTRDNNSINRTNWLSGLGPCVGGSGCIVDVPNDIVRSCPGDCPPLLLSDAAIYNYSLGTPTLFRRTVLITEVVPNLELLVRVTMRWKRQLIERTLTIEEHLLNWQ